MGGDGGESHVPGTVGEGCGEQRICCLLEGRDSGDDQILSQYILRRGRGALRTQGLQVHKHSAREESPEMGREDTQL